MLQLLVACSFLACDFDRKFLEDVSTPATIVVVNESREEVTVSSIYSAPESETVFSLTGAAVESDGELLHRVTAESFDAFRARQFVIEAACSDGRAVRLQGTDDALRVVEDPANWKLTISLDCCERSHLR